MNARISIILLFVIFFTMSFSGVSTGHEKKLIELEEFDYWNTYDSLGEAYLRNGDKENARINYAKSLQLVPDNKNAEKILKTLN